MAKTIQLKRDEIKTNYSGDKDYDLVIIGSGLSGLSTGLMWLKNTSGKKTLIIDFLSQHEQISRTKDVDFPLYFLVQDGIGHQQTRDDLEFQPLQQARYPG